VVTEESAGDVAPTAAPEPPAEDAGA
jgi:hypothetical protein